MITCIVCGCTDENACFDNATGATCGWIELTPGVTDINGGGLCSFCAEDRADDPDFSAQLHAALDRGLNKPADSERDAPMVELVSEHEADLYIRARRATGAGA